MLKKLIRSKFVVTIFTSIITGVLSSLIVSYVKSISIIDGMGKVIRFVYQLILNFFTLEIPVWMILLGIVLIILVVYIVIKIDGKVQNSSYSYLSYTEDMIDGIRWEWNWTYWNRSDLHGNHQLPSPICINCEGDLVVKQVGYGEHLICRHCGFDKHLRNGYSEYHDYIRNEIIRRNRLKEKEQKQASN